MRLLKRAKQSQNIMSDRVVQSRGGLIGNQKFRVLSHRHSNHDALTLSPTHLMRVFSKTKLRFWKLNTRHPVEGIDLGLGRAFSTGPGGFSNLLSNPHSGVQSGHGLLKYHSSAQRSGLGKARPLSSNT